jgi:hypothetical protein
MKSLMFLWQSLATDVAGWCSASTCGRSAEETYLDLRLDKDLQTIATRVEHEGLSFLTITLPSFGKDFERSLDLGMVTPSFQSGFHKRKGRALPEFLRGLLELVFDLKTGLLLDNPSTDAIFGIRQLTLLFQKILLPCTDTRVKDAVHGYIKTEAEIREQLVLLGDDNLDRLRSVFNLLFSTGLSHVQELILNHELKPGHGPGHTADRLLGNKKYAMAEWPERLERTFSYVDYALPNFRHHEMVDRIEFLQPGTERPVRVVTVPKTLKTPRIIAIEPTAMQYMQQALSRVLVSSVESSFERTTPYGVIREKPVSAGFIGFTDQEPNQLLAMKGSLDGSLATLDLSEASDRVSNKLVQSVFSSFPHIAEALDATRTRTACVPGHGVVPLTKFASMGSALTFPVEAMVFLAIIFDAIGNQRNNPLSRKEIISFSGKVRVYGDDIIVPVEYAGAVVENLEAFGFKVNHSKSFWTGKFRESCGEEFYSGVHVGLTRVRNLLPTTRRDSREVISAFSLSNQLYKAGMWRSANYIANYLSRLNVPTPVIGENSPALGLHSFQGYSPEGVCPRLQRPVVRALRPSAPIPRNAISGVFALQKVLLTSGAEPSIDSRHLENSGRPLAVDTKQGWVVAY